MLRLTPLAWLMMLLGCLLLRPAKAQMSNQLPTLNNWSPGIVQGGLLIRAPVYRNSVMVYGDLVTTRRMANFGLPGGLDGDFRLGLLLDLTPRLGFGMDIRQIGLWKYLPKTPNGSTQMFTAYSQYRVSTGRTSRSVTLGGGLMQIRGSDGMGSTLQLSGSYLFHLVRKGENPLVSLGLSGFATRVSYFSGYNGDFAPRVNFLEFRPMLLAQIAPELQMSLAYRLTMESRYSYFNTARQRINQIQPIWQVGLQLQLGKKGLGQWQRASNYQGLEYF